MYHRFRSQDAPADHHPDAATLDWQMRQVKAHHAVWTVSRHHDAVTGKRPVDAACPVVITVDDGYADFHDIAFPIFRQHGIPALLYVTTGFVDGQVWFWWDQVAYLLDAAPAGATAFAYDSETFALDLATREGRRAAWNQLCDRCRFLPDEHKHALIAALAAHLGVAQPGRPPAEYGPVTWDQIRMMRAAGMEFGAHTVSHPILTRIDAAKLPHELRGSRERLETELGEAVPWFCYPQGGPADFSADIVAGVQAAGFAGSYLAYQEVVVAATPYTMPRYCVSADPIAFRWVLCGAEYLGLRLRRLLGRSTGPGARYWSGSEAASSAEVVYD